MKNKKLIWGIVVAVILVVAAYVILIFPAQRPLNCCHGEQFSVQNIYTNSKYNFSFQYPIDYDAPITGWGWGDFDLHMVSSQKFSSLKSSIHVTIESEKGYSCHKGYCQLPAESKLTFNSITWERLGEQKYCDVGQCSNPMIVYRTAHEGNRYYVEFDQDPRQLDFLARFKFLK